MPLIGFLHYRSDPRRVRKAYAFAAVAQAEGIDLMYMTPGRVDVAAEKVVGLVLENGQWVEKTLPLPDVIYNEGMSNSDRSNEVVDWLRERIPFTSHSIGDKVTVYEKVQKGNQYTQYLIPYQEVRRASQVLRFVDKNPKTILKPVWGHQGIGVVYIEKRASGYLVIEKDRSVMYDAHELTEFVTQRLNEVVHVVQKFIICRTKTGAPYDFRLHVQKNGDGQWVITTIYPRVAPSGSLIANISNGGYTNTFQAFLMQEFGDQYFNVKRMLERFALVFAAHMDEVYGESFDELGIDIGLDEDQKIWLFEVNWKPGVPITFYLELDVVQNAVLYAHYLAMQNALDK